MKKKFKKYRIIGDIHGRKNWIDLVMPFNEETLYIFVGDYTDPYRWEKVTYEQMIEQILLMLQFKRDHPENVVLLLGNHDFQYIIGAGETNRYDWQHSSRISAIFKENAELFSDIAFQVGEKYLITHAGVTLNWYQKEIDSMKPDITMEEICDQINKLWQKDKKAFTFGHNVINFSDFYGDSVTHSPIWVRPYSLWENNLFGFSSGKIQIVGHTRFEHYTDELKDFDGKIMTMGTQKDEPTKEMIDKGLGYWINDGVHVCRPIYNDKTKVDIIQIDCLEIETAYVEIDGDTLDWKKIIVEEK